MYYNYHATAKKLIAEGRLIDFYISDNYNGISPALVLIFDDEKHGVMPIREYRFDEYLPLIKAYYRTPPEKNGQNQTK